MCWTWLYNHIPDVYWFGIGKWSLYWLVVHNPCCVSINEYILGIESHFRTGVLKERHCVVFLLVGCIWQIMFRRRSLLPQLFWHPLVCFKLMRWGLCFADQEDIYVSCCIFIIASEALPLDHYFGLDHDNLAYARGFTQYLHMSSHSRHRICCKNINIWFRCPLFLLWRKYIKPECLPS